MVPPSTPTPSTSSRQATLAMTGDDQALADLYVRCRETLLVRAAQLAPQRDAAELEDVVAGSLLDALRMLRAGRWQPELGSFRAWLDRVFHHDLIDHLRREARAPRAVDPGELDRGGHHPAAGPITHAMRTEHEQQVVARVRTALAALHPRYADVLLLRTVLGLDIDATAQELGMQRRQVIDATYEGSQRLFAMLPHGEVDWRCFVRHVEQRVAIDSPAAARRLRFAAPPS